MPYIDWEYAPPEEKTEGVMWVIQLLSDGTLCVACDSDELRVPRERVAELAEMSADIVARLGKR